MKISMFSIFNMISKMKMIPKIKIAKSVILTLLAVSIASLPMSAMAAFEVNSEYQSREPYGNGQNSCFYGAVSGAHTLTPEEEASLIADLPVKENGHYYGRACGNSGTLTLTNYANRSRGNFKGAFATVNKAHTNQIGLEIALGYFYDKNARLELEYLVNRNVNFSANIPANVSGDGQAHTISAQVTNNTFLINGYYDFVFAGYDRFRPFVVLGLGPSFESVKSNVDPVFNPNTFPGVTNNRTKQYVSLAVGGGIGFRFRIFSRWFVTASFRYINLGAVKIEPNPNLRLQTNYYYSPVSLGLIYIF